MKTDLISVIKLGGNIIDDATALDAFLVSLSKVNGDKILVHGGGKLVTAFSQKLGIEAKMKDGRRITDEATLDVVTMICAGLINKKMVARLQSLHCNAIGLCGADGNLVLSEKRNPEPVDFGFVGDPLPNGTNAEFLLQLLQRGLVPVISPLTHDGKGSLLNTNADTMASVIASTLAKVAGVQLIYCFEKNGVLKNTDDEQSVTETISEIQLGEMTREGKIHSGMLPKLAACFHARKNGVQRVVIGNAKFLPELCENTITCTTLS